MINYRLLYIDYILYMEVREYLLLNGKIYELEVFTPEYDIL